jgi:hypothetical protein
MALLGATSMSAILYGVLAIDPLTYGVVAVSQVLVARLALRRDALAGHRSLPGRPHQGRHRSA